MSFGEGFEITGSDLFSSDFAVTSVTDTVGAEFITGTGSLDFDVSNFASSFDVPYEDIAGFGPVSQVGSFAGDATWNNTFNRGDLISGPDAARVPGFGDAVAGSLGGGGPLVLSPAEAAAAAAGFGEIGPGGFGPEVVDRVGVTTPAEVARNAALAFGEIGPGPGPGTGFSLTQVAAQVQTDFAGFLKASQELGQFLNKAAPVFNLVSGVLKIPNPLAPIGGILNQATAVAQAGNAIAGLAVAGANAQPTTRSAAPVRGADGLYTVTLPADQVQTATARSVVVDPQTRANYDTAVNTVQELTPSLQILSTKLEDQTIEINQYQTRISELQSELATNTELTESERQTRALEINFFEAETARVEQERTETSQLAFQTQTQLSSAERIIATVDRSVISAPPVVTSAPGGAPEGVLRELSEAETNALLRRTIDPRLVPLPPNAPPPNYDTAIQTRNTLTPALQIYQSDLIGQEAQIQDKQREIASLQAQLETDPELTEQERTDLQFQIITAQDDIARIQELADQNKVLIAQTTQQLVTANQVIVSTNASAVPSAGAVPGTGPAPFSTVYNPTTNTWSILDTATNTTVSAGLTEQQARDAQTRLAITAASIALNSLPGAVSAQDPKAAALTALQLAAQLAQVNNAAGGNIVSQSNAVTAGLTDAARNQAAIRSLRNNKAQSSDWRVRLRLAPNSNYLYNDTQPGILAALKGTDGVVFPYTPSIETAYKANYEAYDLTHSNYRGYFYRNSYVDVINLRATFTAQDTNEANYLLAVIHFFRSATKMFYGQDSLRGAPPPLVYLNGYGNYQFNEHPCVISQFNYNLPPDVDYIRCQSWLNNNTNLQLARLRNPIANNPLVYSVNRLLNSRLLPGAKDFRPSITNNLADGEPTYVPTKMEISISLLPIQSRAQVSQNFSVKGFADGNLLKGGYW